MNTQTRLLMDRLERAEAKGDRLAATNLRAQLQVIERRQDVIVQRPDGTLVNESLLARFTAPVR